MKKSISIFLSLTILLLSVFMPIVSLADDEKTTINRFNVVFVIDASTSMNYSDSENSRFEATDLFLGMLANEGNYVGTVTFNGNISSTDIVEINGNKSKKTISQSIRETDLDADTDIGGALLKATTLLSNVSNELPSIIILLSDGNTDFDDEKSIQESKSQKEDALEIARDNNYSIYAVSLNSDGNADTKELENIANATENGLFEEVSDASDLKDVFDKFYTKIYGTQSTKLVDETIGKQGKTTKSFTISDVGVEEVNIAIFGDITDCYLTDPDGEAMSNSEMEDITFASNSFRILKLIDPDEGEWKLTVTGESGTNITVVKTYNVNLNIQTNIENSSKDYKVNQSIEVKAKLYENNDEVTDESEYEDFEATMKITDFDGYVIDEIEAESIDADGYTFSFTPTQVNTYYADITVENDEVFSTAERLTFNVGNTTPEAVSEIIKKHVNIWPFLIKTDSTIDLSEAASDNEDEMLQFKVVSSTWNEDDYTIEDSSLTIDSFKNTSKGSFEIQAFDSQGAYCTFNVKVTSTNIGVLAMVLMIVGIILAIAIILIIANYKKMLPFMGDITVQNLQDYTSDNQQKSRGQIRLSAFSVNSGGLDTKSYFQATGKDYIYFISKKPVMTDSIMKKSKKIKIQSNFDVRIYSDDDKTNGIEVRFNSYKSNSIF